MSQIVKTKIYDTGIDEHVIINMRGMLKRLFGTMGENVKITVKRKCRVMKCRSTALGGLKTEGMTERCYIHFEIERP
jgi:hypothetical protein